MYVISNFCIVSNNDGYQIQIDLKATKVQSNFLTKSTPTSKPGVFGSRFRSSIVAKPGQLSLALPMLVPGYNSVMLSVVGDVG